jgi:hypothetical protein
MAGDQKSSKQQLNGRSFTSRAKAQKFIGAFAARLKIRALSKPFLR